MFFIFFGICFVFQSALAENYYLSLEQRTLLSYLLNGAGQSIENHEKASAQILNYLQKIISKDPEIIFVENFEEFLIHFRGDWPNTHSLEKDIELLEKKEPRAFPIYKSKNENLQNKINDYFFQQNRLLFEFVGKELGHQLLSLSSLISLKEEKETKNSDVQIKNWIDSRYTYLGNVIEEKFHEISQTGADLARSFKNTSSSSNKAFSSFITFILSEYFIKMSLKSKKQILNQLFGEVLNPDPLIRFEIMAMNSGPQFQKLLQIVARDSGVSEELLSVFKKLESKVKKVPPALVHEIIDPEMKDYGIIEYNDQALGTGTIAQVHKGRMRTHEQNIISVVIRFIKPDIHERVMEDYEILSILAPILDENSEFKNLGLPKLTPLVKDLTENVLEELRLDSTIRHQQKGYQSYSIERKAKLVDGQKIKLRFHVPKIFLRDQYKNYSHSKITIQELVRGENLDLFAEKTEKELPGIKRIICENLALIWIEELFFKNGFFHSDLHQGNFLINSMNEFVNINILDFGMGGDLSPIERRAFLLLSAGGDLLDSDMVTNAFWQLSQKNENKISYTDFQKLVQNKMSEIIHNKTMFSLSRWFGLAINAGLRFEAKIMGVNRGIIILDKLLENSGSSFTVSKLSRKVAQKHVLKVFQELKKTDHFGLYDFLRLIYVSLKKEPKMSGEMSASNKSIRPFFLKQNSSSVLLCNQLKFD